MMSTARFRTASQMVVAVGLSATAACFDAEIGGRPGSGNTPPGTIGPGAPRPGGATPPIGPGGPGSNPGETGPPCLPAQKSFAPARIWQITDRQYVNVVRDVFGVTLSDEDGKIVSAGD